MKLKLKPIKNKKVMFLLLALAAVLLLGLVSSLVKNISPSKEMYEVVINYNIVDLEGNSTRFDTYRKEHAKGEHINIPSPDKEGYIPDKEKVIAVVKSDMIFTVNYEFVCTHLKYDVDLFYDEEGHWGSYICHDCNYSWESMIEGHSWGSDELVYPDYNNDWLGHFVQLCGDGVCGAHFEHPLREQTVTFTFGGSVLSDLAVSDVGVNGYLANKDKVVLLKSATPEFDSICSSVQDSVGNVGIFPYGDSTLNYGIRVELEYDEGVWGENAIGFKYLKSGSTNYPYSISCGDAWRFIFSAENVSGFNHFEWLQSDDCPLKTSPITIKVTTYYFE